MKYQTLIEERHGTVARLITNRPQYKNAQSRLMIEELDQAFAAANADDEVRVFRAIGRNGLAGQHTTSFPRDYLLCQPHGVTSTECILCSMRNHPKAVRRKQLPILCGRKTRVVQPLTTQGTDGFAVPGATGEQQGRTRRSMLSEDSEHPPLLVRGQMKEAVPSHEPLELPVER